MWWVKKVDGRLDISVSRTDHSSGPARLFVLSCPITCENAIIDASIEDLGCEMRYSSVI